MKKWLWFLGALFSLPLSFIGCATPPQTVEFVDLQRYVGLWYQIAAYPQFFNLGLAGVTAEYTLNDDGTVHVYNRGLQGGLDGPETSIEGTARVVDPETNAKLAVRFNFPLGRLFEGEYWIIILDENYQYAVVTDSRRSSLFILSRSPFMDESTQNAILSELETRGFDTSRLVFTEQKP